MNAANVVRVAVAGAGGRMGRELVRLVAGDDDGLCLAAAWLRPGDARIGSDAGELAGVGLTGVVCRALGDAEADIDVVIDFSAPAALTAVASAATAADAALVCGTTGLGRAHQETLAHAAEAVPVLHAANFSLGVAVLTELAVLARRRLGPRFDIEILEVHHRGKADAPSGTALALGRSLDDASGRVRSAGREGSEIGYAVVRGGGAVGEHTVFFLGPHERLELTHRAEDRGVFAAGALTVARWLAGRAPGAYALADFLRESGSAD